MFKYSFREGQGRQLSEACGHVTYMMCFTNTTISCICRLHLPVFLSYRVQTKVRRSTHQFIILKNVISSFQPQDLIFNHQYSVCFSSSPPCAFTLTVSLSFVVFTVLCILVNVMKKNYKQFLFREFTYLFWSYRTVPSLCDYFSFLSSKTVSIRRFWIQITLSAEANEVKKYQARMSFSYLHLFSNALNLLIVCRLVVDTPVF